MINPIEAHWLHKTLIEGFITYVLFALTSASAGLCKMAPQLHNRHKAYGLAATFLAAAVLIVIYAPVGAWHVAVALVLAGIHFLLDFRNA